MRFFIRAYAFHFMRMLSDIRLCQTEQLNCVRISEYAEKRNILGYANMRLKSAYLQEIAWKSFRFEK